jgi:hypothetical protein
LFYYQQVKGAILNLVITWTRKKKVYLFSRNNEVSNFETTRTFYLLSEVEKCIGTIDE